MINQDKNAELQNSDSKSKAKQVQDDQQQDNKISKVQQSFILNNEQHQQKLINAQQVIGYKFKDISILQEAFTHPSLKRMDNNIKHYQRLEFLGDKILGFVIAEYLFNSLKDQDEGVLSKKQALLVSGNVCYQIALDLGFEKFVFLSNSQDKDGGRANKKILQNITESIIGAIYVDSNDVNIAREFILRVWDKNLSLSKKDLDLKDPKTTLQEWYQHVSKSVPDYKTEVFTANNSNYFEVSLIIKDVGEVRVVDVNRKTATKLVAAKMLKLLQESGKI